MKKFLSVLAIAAIFSLSIVGALAVVPHVHGHDLDHSKHQDCAVYQAGAITLGGPISLFVLLCSFLFVDRIISGSEQAFVFYSASSLFLRAPPKTS